MKKIEGTFETEDIPWPLIVKLFVCICMYVWMDVCMYVCMYVYILV